MNNFTFNNSVNSLDDFKTPNELVEFLGISDNAKGNLTIIKLINDDKQISFTFENGDIVDLDWNEELWNKFNDFYSK